MIIWATNYYLLVRLRIMATNNVGLQEVMDLASNLSPSQQKMLVSFLDASASTSDVVGGSPAAILSALGDPPHVSSEDVDELEKEIAAGKLRIRQEGAFDKGEQ
jgi:hypothetical protein